MKKLLIIPILLLTACGSTAVPTDVPTDTENPEVEQPVDAPDETSSLDLPVIVFESSLAIPDEDEKMIQERILDPFIDYSVENETQHQLLTIDVTPHLDDPMYPYTYHYIYSDGVSGGAAIYLENGEIAYWVPDCMMCKFSESYKEKYPEVVEGY